MGATLKVVLDNLSTLCLALFTMSVIAWYRKPCLIFLQLLKPSIQISGKNLKFEKLGFENSIVNMAHFYYGGLR
jgi:hypothetical protein